MPELMKQISFGKLDEGMEMPHLLEIQLDSFKQLLQADVDPERRESVGLQAVFNDIFPITDVQENYSLEFVSYTIGEPKYSVAECQERDMTYEAPIKATLRLVIREDVEGQKKVKAVTEKEVFLGSIPLLTELGTFVINGAERVIVSQLHRSPGVVFEESIHPNGQRLFSARIIPFRGSWVEFTVDIHDVIYVHIDKKKKFPVTALLRAFGLSDNEEILNTFYAVRDVSIEEMAREKEIRRDVSGALIAEDIVDPETGEVLVAKGSELTKDVYKTLRKHEFESVKMYVAGEGKAESHLIKNTLLKDPTTSQEDALLKIYNLMRSGDAPNLEIRL